MQKLRNIAIIAHVDHGKTTLVDKMILAGNILRDNAKQTGELILDNTQESHTALGEKANFYINYILQSAATHGTGSAANMSNMAVAGKTGTTDSNQNYWFCGYTPYYTAAVWCGYDEPEEVILSGSYLNPAVQMWNKIMKPLHEGMDYAGFYQPGSVTTVKLCEDCGIEYDGGPGLLTLYGMYVFD